MTTVILWFYELPWICISITSYRFRSTFTYLLAVHLISATALWGRQAGVPYFHIPIWEMEKSRCGEVKWLAVGTLASWCWPGPEQTCGDFWKVSRAAPSVRDPTISWRDEEVPEFQGLAQSAGPSGPPCRVQLQWLDQTNWDPHRTAGSILGDARGGSYEGLSRAEAGESPLWQTLPTTAPFLCASDHTGFPYWNHLIPPASQILGYPQSPDQKGLLWAKCSAYTFLFNPLCCLTYKMGIEIPTANIIYPPICRWGKWGSEG